MTIRSTAHPEFQDMVANWIGGDGEVLALFRFHAAAGRISFEFFVSLDDFNNRLSELLPRTSVIVFGERQLPLRGLVNEAFISAARQSIADGSDWILVRLTQTTAGSHSWFHDTGGNSHEELESELRDEFCWGEMVALGPEPRRLEDTDTVISAVIPETDGAVRVGVY